MAPYFHSSLASYYSTPFHLTLDVSLSADRVLFCGKCRLWRLGVVWWAAGGWKFVGEI